MTELDEKIVEMRRSGMTQTEIAKATGVSQPDISRVCKRYGLPAGRNERGKAVAAAAFSQRQRRRLAARRSSKVRLTRVDQDDIDDAIDMGWRK